MIYMEIYNYENKHDGVSHVTFISTFLFGIDSSSGVYSSMQCRKSKSKLIRKKELFSFV